MSDENQNSTADRRRPSGNCPICTTVWPILAILFVAELLAMLFTPADPYSHVLGFIVLAPVMLGCYWLGRRMGRRVG